MWTWVAHGTPIKILFTSCGEGNHFQLDLNAISIHSWKTGNTFKALLPHSPIKPTWNFNAGIHCTKWGLFTFKVLLYLYFQVLPNKNYPCIIPPPTPTTHMPKKGENWKGQRNAEDYLNNYGDLQRKKWFAFLCRWRHEANVLKNPVALRRRFSLKHLVRIPLGIDRS